MTENPRVDAVNAVRDALAEVYAAWSAGDADAFVKPYAETATAILPGACLRGRAAIRDTMAMLFAGELKGSRAVYEVQDIRFVGADVAIVTSKGAVLLAGQGLPLPAGAMLLSPAVDMEVNGKSFETNRDKDLFFRRELVRGFLGEAGDPRDPLVNPLYADLTGLGPIYTQVGGEETLLDDARLLDEHARKAGVGSRLDVFPGMLHTFQMAAGRAPEADDAIRRLADWVRPMLGL
jgi:uncharacterized protein (TIGR02246 family)